MSAMPVVWCTDPNSSNKRTAFALQGIQLEGSISEQHMLAVRELINAAAEGRLLLPTDGGIVLLDCGAGVGSVIIQDRNSSEQESNKENKRSRAINDIVQENKLHNSNNETTPVGSPEVLYEFLCCARCMSEGVKHCHRNPQNLKIVAQYLDPKKCTGRGNAMRPFNHRRKNIVSFRNEKRPFRRSQDCVNKSKIPVYATVNKQQKQKYRKHQQIDHAERNDLTENVQSDAIKSDNLSSVAAGMGRKTSFDSTCTVSSMDSGFMEMQNKLEIAKKAATTLRDAGEIEIKIDECQDINVIDSSENTPGTWNRLTIPSQSRNRRKSYEEFKSLFCDQQKPPSTAGANRLDVISSVKSRRKSYEEFKSATNIPCDSNCTINCNCKSSCINTNSNELVLKNDLRSVPSSDSDSFLKMKRKNSKRISNRQTKLNNKIVNQKIDEDIKDSINPVGSTIYDILRKNSTSNMTDANKTRVNYDKNLELFKSHCNKNNIKYFDNLLSCGTIYDIIQRRSDVYTKNFKRYDKYMTYGTLYEILHRKSDEGDEFERKRTLSEKFSNKRINYAHIDFKPPAGNDNCKNTVTADTDTIDGNLNSTSTTTIASSMKQGSDGANNQLSVTSVGSHKALSTIYDILQTKKLETIPLTQDAELKERNRFLVRKITEEELIEARKEDEDTMIKEKNDVTKKIESTQDESLKKQNRMRRFSNILSYTPKTIIEVDKTSLKVPTADNEKKTNVHLEAKIDELYSRLNRIAQQNETNQQLHKTENEKEPSKIYKSNSMDMLSTLKENEGLIIKQKPFRKISVPTHLPMKILPKKGTRRLSEFRRGEFLNEKS